MNPEVTLAGYMAKHERAAAFTGSDGLPYSCAVYVDGEPDSAGRFGAALLFIRWSPDGTAPVGHIETEYLAWGTSAADAERRIGGLSLYDAKAALDEAIGRQVANW
jgi:hypothetical protein